MKPTPRRFSPTRYVGLTVLRWLALAAMMAVAFLLFQAVRPGPEVSSDDGFAPDFELLATDGTAVRLRDLRGAPVVLNFWATWCPPCRVELPSFASFARDNKHVRVLGIAVNSGDAAQLAAVRKRLDIPYAVLLADDDVVEAYGAASLPTTVLIDADGRLVESWSGIVFGWQLERALPR